MRNHIPCHCDPPIRRRSNLKQSSLLLYSGGIDSTVILYSLLKNSLPLCLSFDYGQRHSRELSSAKKITSILGVKHRIIKIDLSFAASSLTNHLPVARGSILAPRIPVKEKNTYVPGRNIIFLSYALSFAESNGIKRIYIGANSDDAKNFPDCRMSFFEIFKKMSALGMRRPPEIITPLIKMTKQEIIQKGLSLGVPFEKTWSCYEGKSKPCGVCEPCIAIRNFLFPL